MAANPPFQAAAMFTCAVQEGTFPNASTATGQLRKVINSGKLKVAALGPYNWGVDGNYEAEPEPTGFWPDYLEAVVDALSAGLGTKIKTKRVYRESSTETLQLLLDGKAHVSEPYFATNGFFGGLPRQDAFHMSCTTLGYDSTFFARNDEAAEAVAITRAEKAAKKAKKAKKKAKNLKKKCAKQSKKKTCHKTKSCKWSKKKSECKVMKT